MGKKVKQISRDFFWRTYQKSSFGNKGNYPPRYYAQAIGYTKPISDAEDTQRRPDNWLNADFIKKVQPGIYQTWCQIASDLERNYETPGSGKLTNIMCVEACIDAGNLITNCGCGSFHKRPHKDTKCVGVIADEEIHRVLTEYDYAKVLKYLASKIQLR